jgi:hypothetical protein
MKTKTELKTYFETGDKPTQAQFYEWMDSYWHKEEKITIEQTYKTISANTILDDSFHNCIVRITGNATITVPNNLKADFNCVFDAIGNVSANFITGEGTLFSAPFGKILRDNAMCTLYKYNNSTTYRINGGLAPA